MQKKQPKMERYFLKTKTQHINCYWNRSKRNTFQGKNKLSWRTKFLKTEQRQNKDEQGLVKEVVYQQDDFIDNSEHHGPNK